MQIISCKKKKSKKSDNKGHIVVATKYKNITTNYFAKKGM